MKSSDKPEISKKWWTSEKPNDIQGQDLEKALASAKRRWKLWTRRAMKRPSTPA